MTNFQKWLSILSLFTTLVLQSGCGDVGFGGSGSDLAPSASNQESAIPHDDVPSNPPPTNPAKDAMVYSIGIGDVDYVESSVFPDASTLYINLNFPENSKVILFLHFLHATNLHISGNTQNIEALFITANSLAYRSQVVTEDDLRFPTSKTATGYFDFFNPQYTVGSDVASTIGTEKATEWVNGVSSVETFSANLGAQTCYEAEYRTLIPGGNFIDLSTTDQVECLNELPFFMGF